MTYAELAAARGITTGSAEQLTRRKRWPRQLGNDGMVRVLVPLGEDRVTPHQQVPPKPPMKAPDVGGMAGAYEGPPSQGAIRAPDIGDVIRQAIRDAVAPLAAQLEQERARADSEQTRAESEHVRAHSEQIRADSERVRANSEQKRADRAELREDSERTRADSERIRAEELQAKLDTAAAAERIAREAAAGLRAELDARKQWGLWRRLRGR
jgi:hypothetical protein